MQKTLQIKDFNDFEDLFNGISKDINFKYRRGIDITEDIPKGFLTLYASLDDSLTRAGKKPRIALYQGSSSGCSSVEHENLASLSAKVLNLFEAQYVGTDEDRGGKIYEFID